MVLGAFDPNRRKKRFVYKQTMTRGLNTKPMPYMPRSCDAYGDYGKDGDIYESNVGNEVVSEEVEVVVEEEADTVGTVEVSEATGVTWRKCQDKWPWVASSLFSAFVIIALVVYLNQSAPSYGGDL